MQEERPIPVISRDVIDVLKQYSWKGNIRELRNLSERLVILNESGVIELRDVKTCCFPEQDVPRKKIEQQSIHRMLQESGMSRLEFAQAMGMSRTTLWRKLREEQGL